MNNFIIYSFYLGAFLVIQIILLNMLIAVMADTYGRVSAAGENSKLREMCLLMTDNEFLVKRRKAFCEAKYIIVAKAEKADTGEEESTEDQLKSIKKTFVGTFNDVKKEQRLSNEEMRGEIQNIHKTVETMQLEYQSMF